MIIDQTLPQAPFKGLAPGLARPPAWVTQWSAGRETGFVVSVALHGRFRRDENARARSLGYPLMKFPYLPLVGLVVRANPRRILEVYESVVIFRSTAGARSWIADQLSGGTSGPAAGRNLKPLPHLGGPTTGYREHLGPNGNYELEDTILIRQGTLAMKIAAQGGPHLSTRAAIHLARVAERRIHDACASS